MDSSETGQITLLILAILIISLAAGCVHLPDVGDGDAAELRTYLLTEEDVGTGSMLERADVSSHPTGVSRTWTVPPDVSPLKSLTRVENVIYDADDPGRVFDMQTGGNWTHVMPLDIGDRSVLLVNPSRQELSGYRIVTRVRNLVAVTEVEVGTTSFPRLAPEARDYVEDLARRQATVLQGYPYAL